MSLIPQSFIDDLLNRVDIVDVIDRRVKLKKTGKNYSACCPFHDEKTPSFTVSPDKQFYYCFGCGANGNAIGFVMEYERQGFVDAVENLAQHMGLEVPRETSAKKENQSNQAKTLYSLLKSASDYYQKQLKSHPAKEFPVRYLKSRGLTGVIARDFRIGFAPQGWDNLITALAQNEETASNLVKSGLVIDKPEEKKRYDRFRYRIMFPIHDVRGRVIAFGGRVLGEDKPKYLNSPETDVFHKSKELYGLYEARQKNRTLESLLVVEGYMDVIALAQFGITNAVATLGTACGKDHLSLAFRYVEQVIFCFDGDNAGRKAAKRALTNALSSMTDGRQIKFLFLPEGQDPDSLVRSIGAERFGNLLENATPLEDFLFEVAAENIDVKTMDGRARFSKMAAPLIQEIPHGIFHELMLESLARRTGLSKEQLEDIQAENLPETIVEEYEPQEVTPYLGEFEDIPPELEDLSPKPTSSQFNRPSSITLNPVRTATILLVENPQLLQELVLEQEIKIEGDEELERLNEIMTYLKRRPSSNFNNIMGFWAGSRGIEAQHKLAELVANQCFGSVKSIESYDPKNELVQALSSIIRRQKVEESQRELDELKAKPTSERSPEEKKRYLELVSQVYRQKKPTKT